MGVLRKSLSVASAGLIDFRSDKERIARYTRQTRNAVRTQPVPLVQQQTPPGWYPDPNDADLLWWWDGQRWDGRSSRVTR
jgi:hypothetical protein